MATLIFYTPYDMSLNLGFYQVTEDNLVSSDAAQIVTISPLNTYQYYRGNFAADAAGDLTAESVLTGFAEYTLAGQRLWVASGIRVAYSVYDSYAAQNNSFGLVGYALRGADNIAGSSGDDVLYGFAGSDIINGHLGSDVINGYAGADVVFGGDGEDWVRGGADNDTVRGGAGDDMLYGDRGNDTLIGDQGNDLLRGNAGADRFVFTHGSGGDVIADFSGADKIHLKLNINGTDVDSFSDLQAHMSVMDGHTIIDLGGGHAIIVAEVSVMDAGDFVFF